MIVIAFDRSMRTFDADGRLHVAQTNISKATVNGYLGREIPGYQELGLDANRIYQMLRHPDELAKGAATFNNLPLLNVHAATTAHDHRGDLTVGTTGSDCTFDGKYLKCSMSVWTMDAIAAIESGERQQLSCGYRYRPDMTPGVYEGQAYDGVMRDIVGNHVALVPVGRAGPDVVVSDHNPFEGLTMKHGKFIAGLKANKLLAADADLAALDAAIDLIAQDIDTDIWEDDPENPGYKRRKPGVMKKEDEKKKVTGDGVLTNEAIVEIVKQEAIKASAGMVTQDELNARVAEATAAATKAASDLFKAREAVRPFVGDVTGDSAAEVYKVGLEHFKVTLDGLPPESYSAVFSAHAHAQRPASPVIADAAAKATVREAMIAEIPALGRFLA